MKIGDMNNTVVPNATVQADDRTIGTALFDVEERIVTSGDEFEVIFISEKLLTGFKFTIMLKGL